jgi:lysozyme family protein
MQLTDLLRKEYTDLDLTCQVRSEREAEVSAIAGRLAAARPRYDAVGAPLGIPWAFIAAIHQMECSARFELHLHNGDPLKARTVHVPVGRPLAGNPPFTWEESAADALTLMKLNQVKDWSVAGTLYQLERYNGFGYRKRNIFTPYLWAGSNHYVSGKFVADGKFDPAAVSKQIGAALLLQQLRQAA